MIGYLATTLVSGVLVLLAAKFVLPRIVTWLRFDKQTLVIAQGIALVYALICTIQPLLHIAIDAYHWISPF